MNIDSAIFNFLYGAADSSVAFRVMCILFAQYVPYAVCGIAGLMIMTLSKRERIFYGALVSLSVILSFGVVKTIINMAVNRPRPFVALHIQPFISKLAESGMPSGHMTFLIPIALTVFLFNRRLGLYCLIAVLLTGVARIAVGVHYPTDILAGITIGIASVFGIKYILKKGGLIKVE